MMQPTAMRDCFWKVRHRHSGRAKLTILADHTCPFGIYIAASSVRVIGQNTNGHTVPALDSKAM
jgi:hypothetical protein